MNKTEYFCDIMNAYLQGKTIQYQDENGEWVDCNDEDWDFSKYYRIKKNIKPFENAKECFEEMQKHKPYSWVKDASKMYNITIIRDDGIIVNTSIDGVLYSFKTAFSLKFVDGTPFGIKEE